MTDQLPFAVRALADYNRLANERLYAAAARMPDGARKADRGAFFRSIHNTLNHILLADRIWMGRFENRPVAPTPLNTVLYEDFEALRRARQAEDARIVAFFAGVAPDFFTGDLHWTSMAGETMTTPKAIAALHLFNHQTHHRGQVHDLLCQAGERDVVLDLARVLPPAP